MWAPYCLAQSVRGSVGGTVTDASQKALAGATITLTDDATNKARTADTDARGDFLVTGVPTGSYHLAVEKPGYREYLLPLTLALNQEIRVDVPLLAGNRTDTIVVTATRGMLRTDSAAMGVVIENRNITGLPLDGRNFYELALLVPGAAPAAPGSAASVRGDIALNINGAREDANNFLLDGIYNGDPKLNTFGVTPPVDAIQEFEVLTSVYDASFGRNAGGQVNVVMKSGTNALHGSTYEFFRNGAMDARNFFAPANPSKPQYQRNQFGASLGGPIRKNRTFFFADYEGTRRREGITRVSNVPTLAERTGDFSSDPPLINPFTQQPFPGNKIPLGQTSQCAPRPSCVDPATMTYLNNYVKAPNIVINGVAQYTDSVRTTINQDQVTGRGDWLLNANSTIFGRYTYNKQDSLAGGLQPLQGTGNPSASTNAVLHWTQVLSASKVNDLGVSYSRPNWAYTRPLSLPDAAKVIGLPNTSSYTGGTNWSVAGFDLGSATNYIYNAYSNNIQLKDDFGWVKGRHNFKFGFDGINKRFIYYNPSGDKGSFTFSRFYSQACPPGNTKCDSARQAQGAPSGGLEFADYLLGAYSSTLLIIKQIPYVGHQQYLGFYAQDSWRATSKLTLNYGLRYEYWSPWTVPRNTTLTFDFQKGQPSFALQNPNDFLDASKCFGACAPLTPGQPRQSYKIGTLNLAPRLGITYALTSRTVIRAGMGVYYDGNINMNQFNDIQAGAAPFGLRYEGVNDTAQALPQRLVSNEYPAGLLGSAPQPNANPVAAFRFAQSYYPVPAVYQWSASVQQRLASSWVAELDYVGSHTIHQFQFVDGV